MQVRVYPRIRLLDKGSYQSFKEISLRQLKKHFKNYWPMLRHKNNKDSIEIKIDDWFYNRYMVCYDHTILIDGKWRNGTQPL